MQQNRHRHSAEQGVNKGPKDRVPLESLKQIQTFSSSPDGNEEE